MRRSRREREGGCQCDVQDEGDAFAWEQTRHHRRLPREKGIIAAGQQSLPFLSPALHRLTMGAALSLPYPPPTHWAYRPPHPPPPHLLTHAPRYRRRHSTPTMSAFTPANDANPTASPRCLRQELNDLRFRERLRADEIARLRAEVRQLRPSPRRPPSVLDPPPRAPPRPGSAGEPEPHHYRCGCREQLHEVLH